MNVLATYRLQLHSGFRFTDAEAIVDYLADLGVSHVYASPYLTARPGSTHGYDLVDPTRLNPELGSEEDFLALCRTLASRGMSHIVDVVPNHMAATTENAWWRDVLENGPASTYAEHFDIEWAPPKEALQNKVLLPVLGAQYGTVLERGELTLAREAGSFVIRYFERSLPVAPKSMAPTLALAIERLPFPNDDPRRQELASIVTGLGHLPSSTETADAARQERAREKEVLKRRLATLCEDDPIREAIDAEVAQVNGNYDALDAVLLAQNYRLAYWRVATEEINYRRFFDINDLAAVRMESGSVFDDAHGVLLGHVAAGRLAGLRLDHTDGLYDPAAYFVKLRKAAAPAEIYVVAEKILEHDEELPQDWDIEGTTGYDFLAAASGLFVDRQAEGAFTSVYQRVTGDTRPFHEHAHEGKRAIMRASLSSELHMLAIRLERIATRNRHSRDFTLATLRRAIGEAIAAFPVYRTYMRPDGSKDARDESIVNRAVRTAKRRSPEVSPDVFDFLRDVLLGTSADAPDRTERIDFAMRFQQLTGPVMAKGVEDTAFYTYVRFLAVNEVGGDPSKFGTLPAEMHRMSEQRQRRWPYAMTATTTHDTKRGEDVRARLAVLSEMPDAWASWVDEWYAATDRYASGADDEPSPSLRDRYVFFQTAVGAYPMHSGKGGPGQDYTRRLADYAVKAAREAKQRTSWLAPNEAYERALVDFVRGAMDDPAFSESLRAKADAIATYGASNGLALALLKVASPGVVDVYQGSETWDLRLVDPDNRCPVDYEERRHALRSIEAASPAELLASFRDGRIKTHVLSAALRARRAQPASFTQADYQPIATGKDDVFAFARGEDLVCAVTRLPYGATGGRVPWAVGAVWGTRSIELPRGRWRDLLTREERVVDGPLPLSELFGTLPVALLHRMR